MIALFAVILAFSSGVIIGWIRRDSDKERDATRLAEHILRQCEKPEIQLRRVK